MTSEGGVDSRDTRGPGEGRTRGPSLGEAIYDKLRQRIVGGEYPPDFKLPSEHELSAYFDVSRPIVRDALQRLREQGLIYSRQGAGSFVRARIAHKVLGFSPVETIADIQRCYEFRLTIEPDAAALAAARYNQAALDRIAAALDLLHAATRHEKHREDADFAFHLAIAEASNNHYYASSMQALKDHIAVGMKLHGLSLMGPLPQLRSVFDEHRAIHEAIAGRNGDQAHEAMRRHLAGSRDRLFEGRLLDLSL